MKSETIGWMFGRGLLVALFLLSAAGTPGAARAEEGMNAPYVGVGLTYGINRFDGPDPENTFGFDLRGGYRLPHIAAELQMQYYPSFDLDDPRSDADIAGASRFDGRVRDLLVGANLKAYPFSTGAWQPYALIGGGISHLDLKAKERLQDGTSNTLVKDTELRGMLRFGGGLQLHISESIGLFIEGAYVFEINRDADLVPITGGVQIHL